MTPTLTPLPTETPNPVFVWQTDFESGLTGFTGGLSNTNEQGVPGNTANAFYEIVSDPTNSDHGNVYRAVVANFSTFGDGTHRPYPDVYFQIKSGPFAVQLDVWLSQVKPQIRSNWSGNSTWLNLISMKSTADPDYCTFMMVNIEPRNLEAGERIFYATPIVFDYCSDNHYALPINYEVVPEFTFNEWHTVRVNVGQDGSVTLYQDGTLLSAGFLPSSALNRLEIAGGHWGLYGANIEQAEVLNDNIRFDIYPYLSP